MESDAAAKLRWSKWSWNLAIFETRQNETECPMDGSEPVRRNGKLIRGIIENSRRIYLPLWRISSVKFFWTGLRDRPSVERRDSAVPRYLRFAPCRNILRASSVRSFQREVSFCVAIKGPLKRRFQLATNPLFSSPLSLCDRYNFRAEPLRSELHSI